MESRLWGSAQWVFSAKNGRQENKALSVIRTLLRLSLVCADPMHDTHHGMCHGLWIDVQEFDSKRPCRLYPMSVVLYIF